jgi:hypothetical protein
VLLFGGAAAAQNSIVIASANATQLPGLVTVGVTLDVAVDLSLLDLRIDYDMTRLEIAASQVVVDPALPAPGATEIRLVSAGAGTIKWSAGSLLGEPVVRAGAGPLLTLTFTIRDGCPSGPTPLVWTTVQAFDTRLERVVFPTCVAGAIDVQANTFTLSLPALAFANGAGIWDLSGHYETDLGADSLTLDLVHDAKGRISGNGRYATDLPAKVAYTVSLRAMGSGKGSFGVLPVRLGAEGQALGIPGHDDALARVSVRQVLTLDTARAALVGTTRVQASFGSTRRAFSMATDLGLPTGMNGSWGVSVEVNHGGRGTVGTGLLRLSNGTTFRLLVAAKARGGNLSLTLTGDKTAHPAAGGIEMSVVAAPLGDGSARVLRLRGSAFGQALSWTR